MGRVLVTAAIIYALGHPGFEAWRPAPFERSLREFHREVNAIAGAVAKPFGTFDRRQTIHTLNALGTELKAMALGH